MGGKYNDGFTKQAQKGKFIRNRDIKMKDSEVKKEQKIQKLMCEGICRHCREKLQWRFRYDKYKPLKNPAVCQECKQKTIVKAYRTLCDKCAHHRNVCPGCVETIVPEEPTGGDDKVENLAMGKLSFAEAAVVLEGNESGVQKKAVSSSSVRKPITITRKTKKGVDEDDEEEVESEFVWGEEVRDGQVVGGAAITHEDDEDEDEDEDEEDEEEDDEEEDDEGEESVDEEAESVEGGEKDEVRTVTEGDDSSFSKIGMDIAWDEKKFLNIANSKYSKDRKPGQEPIKHY